MKFFYTMVMRLINSDRFLSWTDLRFDRGDHVSPVLFEKFCIIFKEFPVE